MMKTNILTFVSLILAASLLASAQLTSPPAPGCTASATLTRREGSAATWPGSAPGSFFTIYDSVITNTGSCIINNVGLQFYLPSGGAISSTWNLISETLYFLVTGFEGQLPVGAVINVGFIAYFTDANANTSLALAQVYGSACPSSCTPSTTASPPPPTTSSSGSAATTTTTPPSSTTGSPSSSSTTGSSSGTCTVAVTVTRDTSATSWIDSQGRSNSVYRIVITNTGSLPLHHFTLSFSYFPGTLVSSWNLQPTLGGYEVINYGGSLAPGASYSGAGLIVANAPGNVVTPDPYGAAC